MCDFLTFSAISQSGNCGHSSGREWLQQMFFLSSAHNDTTIRHIVTTIELRLMIFFYTLALWLLLPYVFLRLIWRARKQPEYLRHIGERFGFYDISNDK